MIKKIFIIYVYTDWRAVAVLAFFTSLYLELLWATPFLNEIEGGRNVNLAIYIQLEPVIYLKDPSILPQRTLYALMSCSFNP